MGWSELPDDLKVEILCRLPDMPLIQFKCVSKSSSSLVTNACVPKITSSAPVCGLFYEYSNSHLEYFLDYAQCSNDGGFDHSATAAEDGGRFMKSYLALVPFKDRSSSYVQDLCHGLILLVNSSAVPAEYFVCNPITKQCIAIPINTGHTNKMSAVLAFDPQDSGPNYRIIRLQQSASTASESNPLKLDVFSSETGEWVSHVVALDPKLYGFTWLKRSVYLSGVLYKLSLAGYLLCLNLKGADNNAIIKTRAFEVPKKDPDSLPEEDQRWTKQPGFLGVSKGHPGYLGASKGCVYYMNHVGSSLLIWSLKDHCHNKCVKWILKHTINIDLSLHYRFTSEFMPPRFRSYALHPNSEVIFMAKPTMIFSYDPLHERCPVKVILEVQNGRFLYPNQHLFLYSRCLVVLEDFTKRH